MMNAYLLSSSLCVCNDDHLSRDRRRVLYILSPSFLMRVSVVRPHQTLFFSRIVINSFTERERERARGANKTFIEVVPCDSLSVVRSFLFSFLFFFFFCMLKENSIILLSLRLIFFIDRTFVPFPGDSTNRLNYFVNEKRANT